MQIIDSQIHAFYPNTPERPWPEGAVSPHGPQYTLEQAEAQMDAAGVQRAILVPVSWNGWDNEYSLAAARAKPDRFGVMGRFNIQAPDARERLAGWRDQQGMLGMRLFFAGEPWMSLLNERSYDWFWSEVERSRMPFMAHIPGHIAGFEPLLARFPGLRLIVDHAGRHPRGARDDDAWADADQLYALARYPDVAVKVSSLPCFSTQPYPFANLHRHIRAIYDAFGPQRMLWGSDVTRLTSTYEENIRLFTEALDWLSEEDRSWIMGRAAAKCCDWPL
ncbi:amidohydrolase [Roseomonas sp. OT10]|uniref:amidohydrolase family protein n=1 Tax=Roseomonas cutis TaxID=2897332 RepID=UPI001E2E1BD2|nr:amidohydrolase family protein [Roseomonas sp. OT10]UFN47674.1 amidohydrolase [Roseomonas sp. OT10]